MQAECGQSNECWRTVAKRRRAGWKIHWYPIAAVVFILLVVIIVLAAVHGKGEEESSFLYGKFPRNFQWGVATSAYQVEGGATADGKGPNIWDTFCREEGKIVDGSNGDVACDSYHKYKKDVALIKSLGVDLYRFSISWSRLMPDGTKNVIDEKGIQYYNNLIDELIKNGIKPVATLYHWDLPDALQKSLGGWLNDEMVELFGDYADLCFRSFGDRVKHWITLNEPRVASFMGYESGEMAPGLKLKGTGAYRTSYVMLKAHAEAYHRYHDQYKATQNGKVAITLNCDWGEPLDSDNPDDVAAADRYLQWYIGIYAHPIYHGDWPEIIKQKVAQKSAEEGLAESRLPEMDEFEIEYIKGTNDFFGLNSYTTRLVTTKIKDCTGASSMCDRDVVESTSPDWPRAESSWLYSVPWGIRKLLNWIKKEYPNYGDLLITENGYSTNGEAASRDFCDKGRIAYYEGYTNNVLKAIQHDKVNVIGYIAWSLMDNFEWNVGYTARFGIHYVNFSDPDRPRTPKSSAIYFRHLVSANGFPSEEKIEKWKSDGEEHCKNL